MKGIIWLEIPPKSISNQMPVVFDVIVELGYWLIGAALEGACQKSSPRSPIISLNIERRTSYHVITSYHIKFGKY